MNSIRILIVEDEPIIADDLAMTLEDEGYIIVDKPGKAEQALEVLRNKHVDLVLVDIMLQGEMDGISLGRIISTEIGIPFLYLTSLSDKDTLLRVKETRPNGFLVKPIDERELLANIELAIYDYEEKVSEISEEYPTEYFVRDNKKMVKLATADILYLEASDNYCYVQAKDRKYVIAQTMKKVHASLDPSIFCRVHKSYLININKITHLESGYININGNSIPIGRAHKEAFMKRVNIL